MSSGRYYFPEIKEDDTLSSVAQLSKQILIEGQKIVEIFQKNRNILHGKLSEKISFLMKKNSQSIFDLSPDSVAICKGQKESSSRRRKSSADMSTPVKRNPTLPRKNLSGNDKNKDALESETSIMRERILSPKNTTEEIIMESTVEVSGIGGEVFVSPITSKSPESFNDSNAGNKEYPCLDETSAVGLTFISPYASKVAENPNVANDESSHSGQTSEMLNRLYVDDCQSGIPLKVNVTSDYIPDNAENTDYSAQIVENPDNYTTEQGSRELLDECLKIPNQTTDEEHTPSPAKRDKITSNISAESEIQAYAAPDEKVALAINPDEDIRTKVASLRSNYSTKQDPCELLEKGLPIPYLTMDRKHTPSPVKQAKISCSIAADSEIPVFATPGEKVGIEINSDEDPKVTGVSFRSHKLNTSPIRRSKRIAISEEKRKSPRLRENKLFLRPMPRIIYSEDIDELDIELPSESDDSPSPKTAGISTKDFRFSKSAEIETGDNTLAKDVIRNDVFDDSKVERVPKIILRRKYSPLGKETYVCSSQNIIETSSPPEDKSYIDRKISPSTGALKSISPKAREHRINPLKRTSISSEKISNTESPQTDVDDTPENSMSLPIKISPKITKYQFSPSDKKSSENVTEKNIQTGTIGYNPTNQISPSNTDSERIILPKVQEHLICPSEKTSINSNISQSAPEAISPFKTDGYFLRPLSPSVSSLKAETSSDHVDSKLILKQDDGSDSNVVDCFMNKLTKLISMRDDCMNEIFKSFSDFQKELNFFFLYVKRMAYAVEKIPTEGQVYNTEELKNFTTDLTAKAHKLVEKLNLWKTAGDSEVQSWFQYFEDVRYIKSRNEISKTKTSPVEYMSFLRTYEKDLKSVWKKMDDLKILEDSRRSLFSDTVHDFKNLTKLFLKCLMIIGVLKLRSKTSERKL